MKRTKAKTGMIVTIALFLRKLSDLLIRITEKNENEEPEFIENGVPEEWANKIFAAGDISWVEFNAGDWKISSGNPTIKENYLLNPDLKTEDSVRKKYYVNHRFQGLSKDNNIVNFNSKIVDKKNNSNKKNTKKTAGKNFASYSDQIKKTKSKEPIKDRLNKTESRVKNSEVRVLEGKQKNSLIKNLKKKFGRGNFSESDFKKNTVEIEKTIEAYNSQPDSGDRNTDLNKDFRPTKNEKNFENLIDDNKFETVELLKKDYPPKIDQKSCEVNQSLTVESSREYIQNKTRVDETEKKKKIEGNKQFLNMDFNIRENFSCKELKGEWPDLPVKSSKIKWKDFASDLTERSIELEKEQRGDLWNVSRF